MREIRTSGSTRGGAPWGPLLLYRLGNAKSELNTESNMLPSRDRLGAGAQLPMAPCLATFGNRAKATGRGTMPRSFPPRTVVPWPRRAGLSP